MSVDIGDRFHVASAQQIKNRKGQIITTFRPEYDYAVTPRNREIVERMIADGVAAKGGRPNAAIVRLGGVKGRINTGGEG